jgi:hypothetical protein
MLFLILVKSHVIQIHDSDILYIIFCLRGFLQLKPWISEICVSEIHVLQGHVLKVSKNQNDFMKTLFLKKYQRNVFKDFCPTL